MRQAGVHFFLCRAHGAVQQFLEARNSFQGLASVVEHVPEAEGLNWGIWGVEHAVAGALQCIKLSRPPSIRIHARYS